MKKAVKLLSVMVILLLLIGLITACVSEKSSEKKIRLKLGNDATEDYATTIANRRMAELVKAKTNGRITIEVYPNSQLGDGKELIEAVQMNAIQMATIGGNQISEFNKNFRVLEIPYLMKDKEHLDRVLGSDIGKELLDMRNIGIVGLTFYDSPPRNFYSSKTPIITPDDLKGLKVRCAPSQMTVEMVKAFGATATPISFSEVYNALQNKVVIGSETDLTAYYDKGHYEVAKYYTFNEHTMIPDLLIISKAAWDQLSKDDRAIIWEAADASQKYQKQLQSQKIAEVYEKLQMEGVIFTKVEDKLPWIKAMEPVIEKYRETYKGLIERINKQG